MSYTPNDIYKYIVDSGLESDFLQAIANHKMNYSIGEITDKRLVVENNNDVYLRSQAYQLNLQITDEDIVTAALNGLYVSAFVSRYEDSYNIHFLVHQYSERLKPQYEEAILNDVLRYMIMMTIVRLKLDTPKKVREYC